MHSGERIRSIEETKSEGIILSEHTKQSLITKKKKEKILFYINKKKKSKQSFLKIAFNKINNNNNLFELNF